MTSEATCLNTMTILQELFDKNGNLIGALLTADLWAKVKPMVKDLLPQEAPPERPEPIGEWETLKEYWDFPYPVDTDVHCELCGNKTEDWEKDDPASSGLCPATSVDLFHLNAPSAMPALSKKHFKDEITVECTAYIEEKNTNFEARY